MSEPPIELDPNLRAGVDAAVAAAHAKVAADHLSELTLAFHTAAQVCQCTQYRPREYHSCCIRIGVAAVAEQLTGPATAARGADVTAAEWLAVTDAAMDAARKVDLAEEGPESCALAALSAARVTLTRFAKQRARASRDAEVRGQTAEAVTGLLAELTADAERLGAIPILNGATSVESSKRAMRARRDAEERLEGARRVAALLGEKGSNA